MSGEFTHQAPWFSATPEPERKLSIDGYGKHPLNPRLGNVKLAICCRSVNNYRSVRGKRRHLSAISAPVAQCCAWRRAAARSTEAGNHDAYLTFGVSNTADLGISGG